MTPEVAEREIEKLRLRVKTLEASVQGYARKLRLIRSVLEELFESLEWVTTEEWEH